MILRSSHRCATVILSCAILWSSEARPQIQSESAAGRDLRVGDQLVLNFLDSDPTQYETHLVITDVEGSGSVVNVLFFDTSGVLLDEESYFLPIFGKVNYDPAARLGSRKLKGTVRILSDGGNIAAQYWQFHRKAEMMPFNTALPVSDGEGGNALLCQHFVADPSVEARLVLSNPAADSAVNVAVTFFLDRGKQLSKDRYLIPPNGSIFIDPYIANEGVVRTGLAYCEVLRSDRKISGEYWQKVDAELYQVSLPLEIIPKRVHDW